MDRFLGQYPWPLQFCWDIKAQAKNEWTPEKAYPFLSRQRINLKHTSGGFLSDVSHGYELEAHTLSHSYCENPCPNQLLPQTHRPITFFFFPLPSQRYFSFLLSLDDNYFVTFLLERAIWLIFIIVLCPYCINHKTNSISMKSALLIDKLEFGFTLKFGFKEHDFSYTFCTSIVVIFFSDFEVIKTFQSLNFLTT